MPGMSRFLRYLRSVLTLVLCWVLAYLAAFHPLAAYAVTLGQRDSNAGASVDGGPGLSAINDWREASSEHVDDLDESLRTLDDSQHIKTGGEQSATSPQMPIAPEGQPEANDAAPEDTSPPGSSDKASPSVLPGASEVSSEGDGGELSGTLPAPVPGEQGDASGGALDTKTDGAAATELADAPSAEEVDTTEQESQETREAETVAQAEDSEIATEERPDASLTYEAHVSKIGWQNAVEAGSVAGTTGQRRSIEALLFHLTGVPAEEMTIQAHVAKVGWQSAVSSNQQVGTTGQARAIEAINISLSGELAEYYNVWYRVHSAKVGWLDWASNGQNAGTAGYGYGIEAIEVVLLTKDEAAPGSTAAPFRDRADEPASVTYRAHVQKVGWQGTVSDGATAGTIGRALAIEALTPSLSWYGHGGGITARAHVQKIGWQNWTSGTVGTTGRSLRVEAVQFRLTGEAAEQFDIWYRVHVSKIGWMGWASNGSPAGTTGMGRRVEAVQIKLVKKGEGAPDSTADSYQGAPEGLSASGMLVGGSALSVQGANPLTMGGASGSTPIQSFALSLSNPVRTGSVRYRARTQFGSWGDWRQDGAQTDSSSSGLQIEAVQISLSGEVAEAYDVWYRVNTVAYGWSGWACNGDSAGSEGGGAGVRAIEVRYAVKGGAAPGGIDNAYRVSADAPQIIYQAHSSKIGWQIPVASGATAGTTGQAKPLEALRVGLTGAYSGGVEVQAHVAKVGWQSSVGGGSMAGTTGCKLSIEALKVQLAGDIASEYDVIYRVHVAKYGWLGWARNGETAGTTGMARAIEAVEIRLVAKGSAVSDGEAPAYIPAGSVSYRSYCSGTGWQGAVANGAQSGTTGQSRAIDALSITYDDSVVSGNIGYSVYVKDIGWMDTVYNGTEAGSVNKDRQIEAIRISLSGDAATYYDVWYRTYVQKYGWLGWTKNGATAGTGNVHYRMEAFEVCLKPKNGSAPGSTANPYRDTPYQVTRVVLNVPCYLQYPELPTGCESVALTNVLNYYGLGLAKTTMADSYIPRSSSNFVTAFWGNPHSSSGNCCSAPAIVNAANSILSQRGNARRAHDISGVSLEGMYFHLQAGNPVIVWSTMYQANIGPVYARQWYNGRQYFTVTNSHTVVLRGYDKTRGEVYLADSLSGYVTMSASRFDLLYRQRGSQAVVIQ